jgi:hypothetical protein
MFNALQPFGDKLLQRALPMVAAQSIDFYSPLTHDNLRRTLFCKSFLWRVLGSMSALFGHAIVPPSMNAFLKKSVFLSGTKTGLFSE